MKKLLINTTLAASLFFLSPQSSQAVEPLYTTEQAIERYHQYYEDYQSDELVKIEQYRENYKHIKGSLADKVIERAIWYMDNGYTVYGHGLISYHTDGVVDCSEFTKLVYGDFKFILTDVAENYDSVGTSVEGVYPVKENGAWMLKGTEKLLPGDILTWWDRKDDGSKYISHVAIYMGELNGEPAVIGTTTGKNDPTAVGIINNFKYWYGENLHSVQRVLPEGSWSPDNEFANHPEKQPVIPENYILPPQRPIIMPDVPPFEDENSDPVVVTNRGWVSVFDTPSLKGNGLGRLEFGEEAPLIKQYNNWWYEIEFNGRIGYITTNKDYTHVEGEIPEPEYDGPVVLTNSGWVGVFEQPSLEGNRLGRLELGEAAPLIRKYNDWWYEITLDGKTGYITTNTKYTHVEGEIPEPGYEGPVVLTNSGWVGVFEQPSLEGNRLGRLELGKAAPLIRKYNDWWYEVTLDGKTGYITTNTKYTHVEGEIPEPEYEGPVVLTNSGWVGVFDQPSLEGNRLGRLELGKAAPLIRKYNDWWYEITFNGKTGYITTNTKYTHVEGEIPEPEYEGPVVLTNSGWVGVFDQPSLEGDRLGRLELGEAAPLIRKYNDWWYEITFNGQKGYITANTKYTHVQD